MVYLPGNRAAWETVDLEKIAFMAIGGRNTCSSIYNSKLNGRNARIYPETMCF